MKKREFISISKRMVKEYYNRFIAKNGIQKITRDNVETIQYEETNCSLKAILITHTDDEILYGVTYDKALDRLNSYIYNEVEGRINGRKEIMNERVI